MKKIIEIKEIEKLLQQGKKVKVKTQGGEYTEVENYFTKGQQPTFLVKQENEKQIKVTLSHKFFSKEGWIEAGELITGQTQQLCDDGKYHTVISMENIGQKNIVDISVAHSKKCYFGNGILNHNTGKSYMAAQICINAQKMGYNVVYFDSEMAISPIFQEKMGCDLDKFLYIPATTVEMVFETIETILNSGKRNFIVWDSLAQTPTNQSQDAGYDPSSSIAYKARVISNAMQKLTQPIAIQESALLVVNQQKTNIASGPSARFEMMMEPYVTPGGKTQAYSYSLRIWLTKRKAKSAAVVDESGEKYGCEVKCSIKKSRFGSEGRTCHFDIVWGEDYVGVLDEKSWLDAISKSDFIKIGGWCQLFDKDKKIMKQFRKSEFEELCKTDEVFRERVLELMDEEVIFKKTLITEEDLVDDEDEEDEDE